MDGDPNCKLCNGEGRFMQNPTGDHDGTCFLSCPVCRTDRLRSEASTITGASLNEAELQKLKEKYA